MIKLPVVWIRYNELGSHSYKNKDGNPILVIGEDGDKVLLITKPQVFVPMFELYSTMSLEDVYSKIVERMKVIAECCNVKYSSIGTIFGVFRSSLKIQAPSVMYEVSIGLACTANKFNLEEVDVLADECYKVYTGPMTLDECMALQLPCDIDIEINLN